MGALGGVLRIRGEGRSRGFTLIEILVVMLLLGIVAGLVTLRVERDERRMLQREATRAAAALEQAIALAQFQAVTLGISAQGASYRFWQRDGDAEWHVITRDETLAPHALPEGFDTRPQHYAGTAVPPDAILPLRASGRNEPFDLVIATRDWIALISADPLNRVSFRIAPRTS